MKRLIVSVGLSLLSGVGVAVADPLKSEGGTQGATDLLAAQRKDALPHFVRSNVLFDATPFNVQGITEGGLVYGTVYVPSQEFPYYLSLADRVLRPIAVPEGVSYCQVSVMREGAGGLRALISTPWAQYVSAGDRVTAVPAAPSGYTQDFHDLNSYEILLGTQYSSATYESIPVIGLGGRVFRIADLLDRSQPQPQITLRYGLAINEQAQILLVGGDASGSRLVLATPGEGGFRLTVLPAELSQPEQAFSARLNNLGEVLGLQAVDPDGGGMQHRIFVWSPQRGAAIVQRPIEGYSFDIGGFNDRGEVLINAYLGMGESSTWLWNSRTDEIADLDELIDDFYGPHEDLGWGLTGLTNKGHIVSRNFGNVLLLPRR
ncbi:MAG: hypothetical protein QY326_00485 [Bdellovibrionota bacterium]|nr:MAG: hypothetical protein QY326_00485 [Bdellovibrionota bacterium]